MSIALDSTSSNRIERSGLRHAGLCGSEYDSPDSGRPVNVMFSGDLRLPVVKDEVDDSSSSSSIGVNSDSSDGEGDADSGEGEVQSAPKRALDNLDDLEEVLPMKRGISSFYSGKSKSFTSLGDATSCSTIKEIVKPENPYSRKRRNLLAYNSTLWDKNRNYPPRSNSGGISKKPFHPSRSTLALAMTMSSYECNTNSESSSSNSSSPTLSRPPLYPQSRRSSPNNESSSPPPSGQSFSPWRSFSLSDLQCATATTVSPSASGLVYNKGRPQ